MAHLITEGIRHLRVHGIVPTVIITLVYLTNKYKAGYFTRRVEETAESVGENLTVNGASRVTENTSLGDNVNFNGLRVHGRGSVEIGDNFHSGTECLILTENHNYDKGDAIPYDDSYIFKYVTIKNNVWLGERVTIVPGVTIEEGAIIQAGSTVTQDIAKGAIAGGAPAEVFNSRDMEHYNRLKNAGKYH
jgi:acetyltransferase-like isoleucine patch superfamily enzyme